MTGSRQCILTFHSSRNYGAVLQAYALQKKLGEISCLTEILDYRNEKIEEELRLWTCKNRGIKPFTRALLAYLFRLRKKLAFEIFLHKYVRKSKRIHKGDLKAISCSYDIFVTGSDQVWNTDLTDNDDTYFLDFVDEDKCRIAYAASFGDGQIVIDENVKQLLGKFQLITLREEKACTMVKEALSEDAKVCCDPTLLLESDRWKALASRCIKKKGYVFLFMIDESRKLAAYAKRLAEEEGLSVVSNKNCFSFFLHISPNDFLSWVLYADFVVTNSFHGTVFSLLFEKKFVSHRFTEEGKPKVRIIELLDKVCLGHRVTDNQTLNIDAEEDWKAIGNKLSEMRVESWNYMKNWLEDYVGRCTIA